MLPMLLFAFATSITPGPNNTLVMTAAANRGLRASLPVFFGVVSGFILLVAATGLGLGGLFARWPLLHVVLKWACFAWLLVLAWKLARMDGTGAGGADDRPLSFAQLVLFQWINPKAWVMAIGSVALFVPVGADPLVPLLRLELAFVLGGAPAVFAWGLFGLWISRFLTSRTRVRAFNVVMAVLLVASMLPALFQG